MRRAGDRERMVIHHGDFVDLAPDLPPADIVTLDRVICCYHDMRSLVDLSSSRANKFYGFVFPRDGFLMKTFAWLANFYFRLRRNPFRVFVHSTRAIVTILRGNGLRQLFYQRTSIWQVVVYGR